MYPWGTNRPQTVYGQQGWYVEVVNEDPNHNTVVWIYVHCADLAP